MTRHSRQSGYSLMEVLAAIGILGIVSTMAMPATSALMNQYQLRSTADQLAFEIARARTQAIAQHAFVRVRIDGNKWVRERSADGVTYSAVAKPVVLPTGLTASVSFLRHPTFNRSGIGQTSTTIVLRNPQGQKTINTNVVGYITVSN